jgi:hypothetical protein
MNTPLKCTCGNTPSQEFEKIDGMIYYWYECCGNKSDLTPIQNESVKLWNEIISSFTKSDEPEEQEESNVEDISRKIDELECTIISLSRVLDELSDEVNDLKFELKNITETTFKLT